MAKSVKAQYTAQEFNQKMGVHGYFARPQFRGTIDWRTLCDECLEDTTYNPREVSGGMEIVAKKLINYLKKGFRVELGTDFIILYPNLVLTARDYKDEETGKTVVVEPKNLITKRAESRIGCTVNQKYKQTFANTVEWERINKDGESQELDDATQGNENVEDGQPSSIDTSTNTPTTDVSTGDSSSGNGGSDLPPGNG